MKKPKKVKHVPPTPEQRLAILRSNRDELIGLMRQRMALGDFDANSAAIRDTLNATLDIIDYLISLHQQDAKHGKGNETKR